MQVPPQPQSNPGSGRGSRCPREIQRVSKEVKSKQSGGSTTKDEAEKKAKSKGGKRGRMAVRRTGQPKPGCRDTETEELNELHNPRTQQHES